MKHILLIAAALFTVYGSVFADKTGDAIKYSNDLINEQNKVAEKFSALAEALNTRKVEALDSCLNALKKQTEQSMKVLGKMKKFDNNSSFLTSMKNLVQFYQGLCRKDLPTLIKIHKKKSVTLSDDDMVTMDSLTSSIVKREEPLVMEIDKSQKEFAKQYNLLIGRNNFQDGSKDAQAANRQINEAIDYNDSIIVLQNRFAKAFIGFTDIVQKNDKFEVDSSFKDTRKILDAVIKDMNAIGGFKGDNSFRNAAMDYFTSFANLMDKDFTVFLELIGNKAGFSEEDTKLYNEMVYSLPKSIDEYMNKFAEAQKRFAEKYNIVLFDKFKKK